jgi:hypothetical protein
MWTCGFGIKNGKFVHQNMAMFNSWFMYQRIEECFDIDVPSIHLDESMNNDKV